MSSHRDPDAEATGESEQDGDRDREQNQDGDPEPQPDDAQSPEPGDDEDTNAETWGGADDGATGTETETETDPKTIEELLAAPEIDPVMGAGRDGPAPEADTAGPPDREMDTDGTGTETAPAAASTGQAWCRETVDPATRQAVLARDRHRCQVCGAYGPGGPQEGEGDATLEVHHLSRDPEYCGLHAKPNLTTLCQNCHSWQHKQPGPADAPVELSPADQEILRPYDYQILSVLDRWGPATVSEIAAHLYPEHASTAVRERLWTLMGLDNIVESRNRQLIDQDAHTGEWVLLSPGEESPVDQSARGHIPETERTRQIRIEDELVRFLLDHGWDRQVVADAVGIEYRTTWHKERRARAYDIPLRAVTRERGFQPTPAEPSPEAD